MRKGKVLPKIAVSTYFFNFSLFSDESEENLDNEEGDEEKTPRPSDNLVFGKDLRTVFEKESKDEIERRKLEGLKPLDTSKRSKVLEKYFRCY